MAKIKKIIVNYPEDPKVMKEIQDEAMKILARALVKKHPPEVIEEIIKKLEER
ncbi:hypothetical protein [Clostridium botulinum]|uniref:hypothetical protein n=1 Tax=Clostridium botulinum TaxID=1491 RepID=UPI000A64ACBA|nr:hypothetical protein [Clostridium botulinum]MBD5587683.1 hypothetical protein [Clostridium botulinum]MBY6839539.1 hypothetical protein [Clostridium botulinum]MBY6871626.1 hypothetical protein [Clostridium botulinum]MBY6907073.1 hypothetical protein [Clostridium botulinum]MBY6928587.1 hypothetical protein [Clostridium botulinum]